MAFYTYLMASGPYGTLYCGHTDDLTKRVWEHKEKVRKGFTSKYDVTLLVWYEVHDSREGAKAHEQRIKKWNRKWKVRLIEETNPEWRDLYEEFLTGGFAGPEEWVRKLDENASPTSESPREGRDPS